ncbi:MAG TPA: FlgD immunoglobulin-like domain containing protein [bacterium]|nr:FlgD immunoglobulin-like domain containing protein [bacterium]
MNSPALPRTEAARGPINLDQDPKAHYSGVSVQVHLTHPGPLQVKVFDTRGVEVTPLYSGSLGTGHWVFEWDGRLANGELAAPGFYQIEVRVGSFSQRKSIQIR